MAERSPAQLYALIFGVVLVAAGIMGFFYEGSFSTGDDAREGRRARHPRRERLAQRRAHPERRRSASPSPARTRMRGSTRSAFGAIYIVVAILGFIYGDGDSIFKPDPRQHRGQRPARADRRGGNRRGDGDARGAGADDGGYRSVRSSASELMQ